MSSTKQKSLEQYKIGKVPNIYYIKDFIDESEEKFLLEHIYTQPASSWKVLSNRRLQNHGGIPHEKGMFSTVLPPWLQKFCIKINETFPNSVFPNQKSPNHVLINEYMPQQGILAHKDGPVYLPHVAIISLESPIIINFKPDKYEQERKKIHDFYEDEFSVLLEPRSLYVFSDDVYHHYLHSIDESPKEVVSAERNIVNIGQSESFEIGDEFERKRRVSLTFRVVAKVIKKNNILRLK